MASLLKKKKKNNIYYSYVESKRINGKPRLVKQIYLGNAETILKKIQDSEQKFIKASHFKFGLESALYQIANELNLDLIINSHASSTSPSLDVGEMIVSAAINRACDAKSKRGICEWWQKTTLPELFSIPSKNINSKRYWDAMDRIPVEEIPNIEERIWENLLENYNIVLDALLYDTTNYYSYMDSGTESEICRPGKNKAGKHHLRQVGLAMAIDKDSGIPFLHQIYQGNINDVSLFPTAISTLISRYKRVKKEAKDITIVYDKGNNSEENSQVIKDSDIYVVGSLIPSEFPELLKVRLSRYKKGVLKNGQEVQYFDTEKEVFGKKNQVVITFNKQLKKKKEITFNKKIGDILTKAANTSWNRVKNSQAKLKEIVNKRLPVSLFKLTEGDNINCIIDKKAVTAYKKRFGKNIIYTTNPNMKAIEVIQFYRDRNDIEAVFAEMNDPKKSPFRPVYHWTDQKITIHAFICILGLLLLKVLEYKIQLHNMEWFKITKETLKKLQDKIDVKKLKSLTNKEFLREKLIEKLKKLNFNEKEIQLILNHAHNPKMSPQEVIKLLRDLQTIILIDQNSKIQKILSYHNDDILLWLKPLGLDKIVSRLGIQVIDP